MRQRSVAPALSIALAGVILAGVTLAGITLAGDALGADTDVDVEVRRGRTILSAGDPAAGAWVASVPPGAGPDEAAVNALATGEDGHVLIPVSDPGALLLVWADESAPQALWTSGLAPEPLSLEPGRQLVVRVQSPSGKPLAKADVAVRVRLRVAGSPPRARAVHTYTVSALTDAHGHATIEGLPKDSVSVSATADGWVDAPAETAHPKDGGVTITLRRGARVSGIVRQVPGGAPAEGAEVVLRSEKRPGSEADPPSELRARVDADGAFVLGPVVPGSHTLDLVSTAHVLAEPLTLVLTEGEQRDGLLVTALRTSQLHGRVRGPDGKPRPDTTLSLLWPGRSAPLGERRRTFEGVVDEEGRFALTGLRPGDGITLEASAPGVAQLVVGGISLPAGEPASPIDVRLQRGASLAGTVLGPAGLPSTGTRVEAWRTADGTRRPSVAATEADELGRFVLSGLPLSPVRLRLTPPEDASGATTWVGPFIGGAEPNDVGEVRLENGWPLRVQVQHAPEGAFVQVHGGGEFLGEAELDADGGATFSGLPWGQIDVVAGTAARPNGARASVAIPLDLVELTWDDTIRVDGVLRLARGGAVPDATLVAEPVRPSERRDGREDSPGSGPTGEALTFHIRDVEGVFAIELAPGPWRLSARAGSLRGSLDLDVARNRPHRATLELSPGELLRGEVGSAVTGGPLEGAVIEVDAVSGPSGVPARGRADAHGVFIIEGLDPGIVRLRISAPGHAPYETRPLAVRRAETLDIGRIDLLGGVRLGGSIYVDGVPAAGVDLHLEHDDGWIWEIATDVHGRFDVSGVPSGGVVMTVRGQSRRISVPGGRELHVVDLDLSLGTHLTGRITRDGRAVAYARVTGFTSGSDLVETSAVSDARGMYRLPRLPPGQIGIEVLASDASDPWTTTVLLPTTDTHFADLELPAGAVVGQVRSEIGGAPVPGAFVWLWSVGAENQLAQVVARTTSDAEGQFRIGGVAAGHYEVEARRDGFGGAHSLSFDVLPDAPTFGVVATLPQQSSVRAEIVGESGRAVPRAWIAARRTDDRVAPVRLRAYAPTSGRVSLGGLGPGSWEISVGAPGYGRQPLGVVSLTGGVEDVGRIHLERSGALRVAILYPGGYPAEGISIVLEDVLGRDPRELRPPPGPLRPRDEERTSGPDGTLVISDLAPGTYTVRPRNADLDVAFPVRIEPGDVSHVLFWVPWTDDQ